MEDKILKPGRGRARGRARMPGEAPAPGSGPSGPTTGPGVEERMAHVGIQEETSRVSQAPPDARFIKDEQEKRWTDFRRARDYLETRPEHIISKKGDGGRAISLAANYFTIQLRKMEQWRLNQYRIDFEPDQDSKRIRKVLIRQLKDMFSSSGYIYDGGHMLFSTLALPADPTITSAVYSDKGIDIPHTVTFKIVKDIPWNDADMIHFYNIVTRVILEKLDLTLFGRFYYDPTLVHTMSNYRLTVWPGYKTVLRPFENSLMMNVEMVSKVIRSDTVLQMMQNIKKASAPGSNVQALVEQMIVGTIVMTEFNRKTYRISEVDWGKKVTNTFTTRDGEITFVDYYEKKYGIKITNFTQPLLVSPPLKRDIRRGDTEPKLLVPELCVMTGLTDDMRNNFQLMRDLKSHLIVDPYKRVDQIQTFMKRIVDNPEIRATMADQWGIRVPANDMVKINGRVLPPERIMFGQNQDFLDESKPADWTNAFRSRKVFIAVPCINWAVLVSSRDAAAVDNMISTLQKVGNPLGYQISRPFKKIVAGSNARAFEQAIDEVMSHFKGVIDMIFIVLPSPQANLYAAVKKRCAVDYGVSSQCCLSKNVQKANMSVCTKIAIQMIAKQGGEPWGCSNPLGKANLMVVGYDVYHSGGPADKKTLVGAMVASLNSTLTRYTSIVQTKQKQELSKSMGQDLKVILQRYREFNLKLPSRIMFYRDGVGEGQLGQVADTEVADIEATIGHIYTEAGLEPPKLSFIVVSKRISARFFEAIPGGGNRPPTYNNPPPGTVVDDVITLPERYDFYLVSQLARQGTVSPTSYNIILDHPSLTPKQMQIFSYKLCHMYYNWSGTVSVPSVCQYAHKLAYLTGMSLLSPAHEKLTNLLFYL
ncbi:piwi-like protein Siwi [Folsomia candida]|uniref:piwi-like protein Siwi n=1 Tax=Folsomia candida TaxID=158441 RepID=UPI000B907476|nr:piwi-like protein Siwi [Folsomia candida]